MLLYVVARVIIVALATDDTVIVVAAANVVIGTSSADKDSTASLTSYYCTVFVGFALMLFNCFSSGIGIAYC